MICEKKVFICLFCIWVFWMRCVSSGTQEFFENICLSFVLYMYMFTGRFTGTHTDDAPFKNPILQKKLLHYFAFVPLSNSPPNLMFSKMFDLPWMFWSHQQPSENWLILLFSSFLFKNGNQRQLYGDDNNPIIVQVIITTMMKHRDR